MFFLSLNVLLFLHSCIHAYELHIGDGLEVFVSGFMCCMADEFDPEVALSRTESSVRNEERQRDRSQTRTLNHPDQTFRGEKGLNKVNWCFSVCFFKGRESRIFYFYSNLREMKWLQLIFLLLSVSTGKVWHVFVCNLIRIANQNSTCSAVNDVHA